MNALYRIAGLCLLTASLGSCNSFLDTPPDTRTELNRADKIERLLVSAYPTLLPMGFTEYRTDNAEDNGRLYEDNNRGVHEAFFWEPSSGTGWDDETQFWSTCYDVIGTANQALKSIEELGSPRELQAARGEALLCRAYTNFIWVNVFGQAYNSKTSDKDLGIPYFTTPEHKLERAVPRLSVAKVYELIAKDIEEGLPLIDDDHYTKPIYHFTARAAKAFATQFYLYYEKWDKAKKYADEVLGTGKLTNLRDMTPYSKLTNTKEISLRYISDSDPANLMILTTRSLWGRGMNNNRYTHNGHVASTQTYRSPGPWGAYFPVYDLLYGRSDGALRFPKYEELFEITNVAAQTGQPHIVALPFTTDRVLLWRAEARVMLSDFDGAASDLSQWYVSKQGKPATAQAISDYYAVSINPNDPDDVREAMQRKLETVSKPLHPKFDLAPGMQTNMMQAVLHARRIVSVHDGSRWDYIKRYGIEITHKLYTGDKMTLKTDDPRRALQIPASILSVGVEPNPGY